MALQLAGVPDGFAGEFTVDIPAGITNTSIPSVPFEGAEKVDKMGLVSQHS